MKNRSIIATLFFVILCAAVVLTHPFVASAQQKNYYVTSIEFPASKALAACISGYHMASVSELSQFGSLHYLYNSPHAFKDPSFDQGHGPPMDYGGWIRTGEPTSVSNSIGANCSLWTSSGSTDYGTQLTFVPVITGSNTMSITMEFYTYECVNSFPVWCIQNP